MKRIIYCSALLSAGMLAGCMTYQSPAANRQSMRQREDMRQSQERLRRVTGDMETLQMEIERLSGEMDQLRQLRENDIAVLESKIQQLSAAQAKDKKEIINALSARIELLLKNTAPSAPSGGSGSEYGIEHVVQPGETLSAIAKAYGVGTKAIISANKIKNPNRLSVGQKLFIPQ
ncbi:LysM peptidoglycan-binding domain-containing protein [Verrucomicrobiota bacterium]